MAPWIFVEPQGPNALDETERLRRQCELFRRLLQLGTQHRIEPFLADALALAVEVTGARRGYLELADPNRPGEPGWWMARGCDAAEVDNIRRAISRGIVAEAIVTGRTVVTSSALLDPRFGSRDSVKGARIESVLCAPVGESPPVGVVYLEGSSGGSSWSEDDRELAELFAHHLAPLADGLLARRAVQQEGRPDWTLPEGFRVDDVIGASARLGRVLQQAALVAPLDVSVLLTGDSGTGKTQLARVIHRNSARAAGPFVELNCAALPDNLLESELFGARKGSHSTADRTIPGKVAAAERGTLFLDEIGDLSLIAQAKVLQLLQSKLYYPLGAQAPVSADVRVIAATNHDLEKAVAERRFREDLLYRLQVVPIRLPSLAERRDDLADLARHFADQACERYGLRRVAPSTSALRAIEHAEWPGNVRQLAHALEAAAIRAAGEHAARIEPRHMFPNDCDYGAADGRATFQEATRRFQRDLLRRALEETGWNVVETAKQLDLSRSHVYDKIAAFNLRRD
jgi:Nif-specific regulatory protein